MTETNIETKVVNGVTILTPPDGKVLRLFPPCGGQS